MRRKSFSILFFLRKGKLLKNGQAPICMRITVDKRNCDILIRRSIPIDQWNQTKECAKGKNRAADELNLYIESVRAKVLKIHRELEIDGKAITVETIRNRYQGLGQENKTLLEAFDEHNKEVRALIGKDFTEKTVMRYESTAVYLKDFLKKDYRLSDIPLREIDLNFLRKFETYLKVYRNNAHNSVVNRLKNIKKIIGIALVNGILKQDPFLGYKFRIEETHIDFLTQDELETLMNKELSIPRLDTVRDIFVFCCFTALAFTDIHELQPEHLVRDSNGALWIRKPRQKTNNMCNIPVLSIAEKLIDKYATHPECMERKRVFPVSSNQRMNGYLKELADICGITKNLTTHMARHTAASVVFLANNVSLENVAKILGHSNTLMTQHYAKVLDKSILRDMANVEAHFNKR